MYLYFNGILILMGANMGGSSVIGVLMMLILLSVAIGGYLLSHQDVWVYVVNSNPPILVVKNVGDRNISAVYVRVGCLKGEPGLIGPVLATVYHTVEVKDVIISPPIPLEPGDVFEKPIQFSHVCDDYSISYIKVAFMSSDG